MKSPLNVKNCPEPKSPTKTPQFTRPACPDGQYFPLPRIPKRKQTDTKDQIKQGTLGSYYIIMSIYCLIDYSLNSYLNL